MGTDPPDPGDSWCERLNDSLSGPSGLPAAPSPRICGGALVDRLNGLPKYVVSSTLEHPDWNNSMVLKGDAVTEVSKLKKELNCEIQVAASFQLVHTLMEHDRVDDLRLKIFPVVLGAGEGFFGDTSDKKAMRLVDTRTVESDVVILTYERMQDA